MIESTGRVFLSGATGFVGSAVLRALLESGFSVRALARPNSPRHDLAASGVEFVDGDLRDRASVASAMKGCRYAIHTAADYRLWSFDRSAIFETNLTGTRHVMEEALRAGVERVIYTSSVATLALRRDGSPADETISLTDDQAIGAYKRSKIAAERLVLAMVAEQGLPAVIVNPSTPVGPRDIRPTPTGRTIIAAASGRLPVFVDTGLNLVHVDDVAHGHLAALRLGRIGERYILGGSNVLFSQLLGDVAGLMGRSAPRIRIPWQAALPVACGAEAVAWVTGREPLATLYGVRMAKYRMFFCAAKAEQELGFRGRPHIAGLQDALRWFADAGYLKSRAGPLPAANVRGAGG
jgi:dihydroflavonol-4-reductase